MRQKIAPWLYLGMPLPLLTLLFVVVLRVHSMKLAIPLSLVLDLGKQSPLVTVLFVILLLSHSIVVVVLIDIAGPLSLILVVVRVHSVSASPSLDFVRRVRYSVVTATFSFVVLLRARSM